MSDNTMTAVVITQPGGPEVLDLQQRQIPSPDEGQVLIEVHAAGVNRPDIFQRKGNYPAPTGAPADIPGLEVAGVVRACGRGVTRWKPGDAVCALLAGGGYATFARVAASHCLPLPANMDFVQAAALPETGFTVWHNVFQRGNLKRGEHLLVHGGSSGIGTTAIQLARAFGNEVSTTAGGPEKCEACIALGANRAINYKHEDFEELLLNHRPDVILDMVGGDYTPKNLRLLNDDGRLVIINAMTGGRFEYNAIDIMRRRLTITGSTLRARSAQFKSSLAESVYNHVWPLIETGKLKPIIFKTFTIANAADAHKLMEGGTHVGKIVLTMK